MLDIAEAVYPSLEHAQCPYPFYDDLRAEHPVVQLASGEYVVSRWADVHYALEHTELFSSDIGDRGPRDNAGGYKTMLNSDPPENGPKRRLAFAPLRPAALKAAEPMVRQVTDGVIDRFIDAGEAELISQFAMPIPIMVTSALMGLPGDDYDELESWADLEGSGRVYLDTPHRLADEAKNDAMVAYLSRVLRERRAEPGEDILSSMIAAHIELEGEYRHDDLLSEAAVLLLGGIVTTAHMIGSALRLLLDEPQRLDDLRADPANIPRLLEEVLRVESPVQWRPRRAVQDVELSGVRIPAGSSVLLLLGAANRDERCFAAPEAFDPHRGNVKRHMAFGYGTHFCLGAPLARLEGRVAFERLLERVDLLGAQDGELHGPWVESVLFRAPQRLSVALARRDR